MHNFPSPWRINHAGEVVRDVDLGETLRKVSPQQRKSKVVSDSQGQDKSKNNTNKDGKMKESWFRIARKKKKDEKATTAEEDENTLSFLGLESILENMDCFACGPPNGASADDSAEMKKKRLFSTLTMSTKVGKSSDEKQKKT